MEKRVALCVGHSRLVGTRAEGGARSVTGVSEWEYNSKLARLIAEELHDKHGISALVIDLYQGGSYGSAMAWVGATLRHEGDIALAVELHFNAADGKARGHEWLHWHSSPKGKVAATLLHLAFTADFPPSRITTRGVKPKDASDRGAAFLKETPCPAVIAEPFFGDNAADWKIAKDFPHSIARAMARGIANAMAAI
jgi:N-acetylmuramoyl-L-alanine amidase